MAIKAALDPHLRIGDVILGFSPMGVALRPAYEQRFGLGPFATLRQVQRIMGADLDSYTTLALICDPGVRVQRIHQAAQRDLNAYANQVGCSLEDCKAQLLEARGPRALLERTPIRALAGARDDDDFVARLIRFSVQADGTSLLSYAHWLKGIDGELVDHVFRHEQIDALRAYLDAVLGVPLMLPSTLPSDPGDQPAASLTLSTLSCHRLREALQFDYDLYGRCGLSASPSAAQTSYKF